MPTVHQSNTKMSPEIVYLRVQDTELPVNCAKLCQQSPVFAEMFTKYNRSASTSPPPVITDIEVRVFKALNQFVWKGQVNAYSMEKYALDLLRAADKYQISTLKQLCEQHLSSKLTPDTVLERFHLSEQLHCPVLQSNCIEYIHANASAVLATAHWTALHDQSPEFILHLYRDLSEKYRGQSEGLDRLERHHRYRHFYDLLLPAIAYLTAAGVLASIGYLVYLVATQVNHILPATLTVLLLVVCVALVVERVLRNRPDLTRSIRTAGQRVGLVRREPVYCTAEYHPGSWQA